MSKLYAEAADVVFGVLGRRGSVRSLCFDEHAKITDRRACFALASSVLARSAVLEPVVDALQENDKQHKSDEKNMVFPQDILDGPHGKLSARRALVMTMVHDLLFSRSGRISGGGALKRALEARSAEVRAAAEASGKMSEVKAAEEAQAVCYVRVNSFAASVDEAEAELAAEKRIVESVCRDEHMPELVLRVVLKHGVAASKLNSVGAVRARRVIVQSKPSCMPPVVLGAEPGSLCIDCCAAPGNKTSLLAALIGADGRVVAFDRDEQRLATMRTLLANSRVKNVVCRHQDFLTSKPDDPELHGVKYIMLDPSCSGSGLLDRPRSQRMARNSKERQRVRTLSHFQLQMLRHALSFNALRVVYSTCSINREEDEEVVKLALESCEGRYVLVNALPTWPRRGDTTVFTEASKCVRVDPDLDGMTGFFVACFQRADVGSEDGQKDEKEETVKENEETIVKPKKKKPRH